jgi:DNA-binding NtrC family response regulator
MTESSAFLAGSSEAVRALVAELEQVAASEATVLIAGESGSGKGAAARALHSLGTRAAGPLVTVSLAALAPTLIEAALFGQERGAFTGADRSRPGFFRQAEGGTLLLDDVDLLPREAQVKLLRALQEREVEPLGADRPVPVNARVVATSNSDLWREVGAGRFREDLYFRLAVVVLTVPPLRARLSDLEELVRVLLPRIAERAKRPVRSFTPAALERLRSHSWPGNVRELENALERVLVLGDGGPVEAHELGFLAESVAGAAADLARAALSSGLSIDALALAMMELALGEERGNVSAAARRVGLTRRAFDYRMSHSRDAAEASPGEREGA